MNKVLLLSASLAILLPACASNAKNPISEQIVSAYNAGTVSVSLAEGKKIPNRYDKAAREYLDTSASDTERAEFEAFANGLAPSADDDSDYTGEAFLTWLIYRQLDGRMETALRGETEAALDVELQSTTWPNTATMMLVGEMIGTSFEFSLTDGNEQPVVESVGAVSPFIQRSAGAGGGLLGLALRSGSSQQLTDLERVADGAVNLVMDILTASELPSATLKTYKYKGTKASELSAE